MINLSTAPLRRPLIPLILFTILAILGLRAFTQLKIADMPPVDQPDVVIVLSLPGATPSQIEGGAVMKIEDGLASLESCEHVYSRVRSGSAEIHASFALSRPAREALTDVRDLMNRLRATLPPGTSEPAVRLETTARLLLTYVVEPSASLDPVDATSLADTAVSRALAAIPGVDRVTRQGGAEREVRVALDPLRLAALHLPPVDVARQLRAALPGASAGLTEIGGKFEAIGVQGASGGAAALARIGIRSSTGLVKLGDIATVDDTTSRDSHPAYFNGKPVVALNVYSSASADEVTLAAKVRSTVDELNRTGLTVHVREVSNQVEEIAATYRHSMNVLYTGCLLTVVVVGLFLRDLRATLIAALALPFSALPTFIVMQWSGYSLNTVTLLALTLVIGVLIDDAIVEVENISRHLRRDVGRSQAIADAVSEIALTVLATSLAVVAIFLPTAFLGGVTGRYFWQFGWTASVAVLSSLLVARLLVPVLALGLLKKPGVPHRVTRLPRRYLRSVSWCMRHGVWVGIVCIGLLCVTIGLFLSLPRSFLPPQDSGSIVATASFANGRPVNDMTAVMLKSAGVAAGIPEIASTFVTIGTPTSPYGAVIFTLVSTSERHRSQTHIAAAIRARLANVPGARFVVDGEGGENYRLVLTGNDPALLEATAKQVMSEAERADLYGIASSESSQLTEWVAKPDPLRSSVLGVSADAINQSLRIVTGDIPEDQLPYVQLPFRQLRVRTTVALPREYTLSALEQLPVPSASGSVPLGLVASLSRQDEPALINRYDRQRNITLYIPLESRTLGQVAGILDTLPSMRTLPAGIRQQPLGDAEFMGQLFGSFFGAMIVGVAFIYLMLVVLFNDLFQPLTILVALPLSIAGSLGGLYLVGYPLSLPAVIGLMTLLGLVAKNSILLVEYAVAAVRRCQISHARAILLACRYRVRPVIMTSCAMLGGMLPLALNVDADSIRAQLGLTVACGLLTSTVLSLLLVPLVYLMLAQIATHARARIAKPEEVEA